MLEKGSNKRTFPVDRHAGMVSICASESSNLFSMVFVCFAVDRPLITVALQAVAGVIADGRQVVNRAFDEAVQYKR